MPRDEAPLPLFRLFARHRHLAEALHGWGSYQLGRRLSLGLRDRDIVIDRTRARCGCAYEWGVHIARFAARAGLTAEQVDSLTYGTSADDCWTAERDRLLLDATDALHTGSRPPDAAPGVPTDGAAPSHNTQWQRPTWRARPHGPAGVRRPGNPVSRAAARRVRPVR